MVNESPHAGAAVHHTPSESELPAQSTRTTTWAGLPALTAFYFSAFVLTSFLVALPYLVLAY